MKNGIGYLIERGYPFLIGIGFTALCKFLKIDIQNNVDFKEVLNGLITLDSIIIGFLGAIMPVILSMKNESKFVKYVFEKDKENLFAKYLKVTILLGLINAGTSLIMHVKSDIPMIARNVVYYVWIFVTIAFMAATYRSMSHMITLIFSKDEGNLGEDSKSNITEQRKQELKSKYKAE